MENAEPTTTVPRKITQEDIDAALQAWNGDAASKRRVQAYMTGHAREKGTAEWLKNEYGNNFPACPVRAAGGIETDLPWPKVQRHLVRLVKEDRFFTLEEFDRFDHIDAAAVWGNLEQAGDEPSTFVKQVIADVERIAAAEAAADEPASPDIREAYEMGGTNESQRAGDTVSTEESPATPDTAALPIRDPLAPAYKIYEAVGNMGFKIGNILDITFRKVI